MLREYIVTCESRDDLQSLYDDLETAGGTDYIPERSVQLLDRREFSRNTHYSLTDEEAENLLNDSRVKYCELTPEERGFKRKSLSYIDNIPYTLSGEFTKDSYTDVANQYRYQWGHLHSSGNQAQRRKGSWGNGVVSDTTEIFGDGRYVDVVIVDDEVGWDSDEWESLHLFPGQTRFVQENWTGSYGYPPVAGAGDHGMHVAGTVAGKYYGWAREATIRNIAYSQFSNSALFDYIYQWHLGKQVNPNTGKKNPTVVNNSWGYFYTTGDFSSLQSISWNGVTYSAGGPGPSGWTEEGVAADFNWKPNTDYGVRVASVDTDIEDLVEIGVIVVGAAGNSNTFIVRPQDPEFNNSFYDGVYNVDMCKGPSPGASEGSICVGALGKDNEFRRATFTCFGPRIDCFAPGVHILSVGATTGSGPITRPGYPQQIDRMLTYSGTSMASPQVAGIAACIASGRPRVTQEDIIGYVRGLGLDNDMTFDVTPGYNAEFPSFYIDSVNTSTLGWRFSSGDDRNGPVNTATFNPPITIREGDYLSFTQPSGGAYAAVTGTNATKDYTMTVQDRVLDGSQPAANDPTINVEVGDLITIETYISLSAHPMYIRDYYGNNISGVQGQGMTAPYSTLFWDTAGVTPGTYYYECGTHSAMRGEIIVHAVGTYWNHPMEIRSGSSTGSLVPGVTNNGSLTGVISWNPSAGDAGTYYYVCGNHGAMWGELIVDPFPGVIGQQGNFLDETCSKRSPNREVFCDNPRPETGYISGWKMQTLNGRRRTDAQDQFIDRQIYPRVNSLYTP